MINATRRFFLGGAISALVVATVVPRLDAKGRILAGNTPVIYGNGIKDDSAGLAALMRGEPVIFGPDKIGIDEYGSVTIHDGKYRIDHTVEVNNPGELQSVQAEFIAGLDLPDDAPLFRVHSRVVQAFTSPIGMRVKFRTQMAPPDGHQRHRVLWIEETGMVEREKWDPRPGPVHDGETRVGEIVEDVSSEALEFMARRAAKYRRTLVS